MLYVVYTGKHRGVPTVSVCATTLDRGEPRSEQEIKAIVAYLKEDHGFDEVILTWWKELAPTP